MFFQKKYLLNKIKYFCLIFTLSAGLSSGALAETSKVIWGGVGFSSFGDNSISPAAEEIRLCARGELAAGCEGEDFYKMTRDIFKSASFDEAAIEFRVLSPDERIGKLISPVINSEFVARGKSFDKYHYTFIVLGSLLVYELSPVDTNYIYSVPFGIQTEEYFLSQLSEAEERAYIKNWYTTSVEEDNFFHQMALYGKSRLKVPESWPNRVKFTSIEFSDSVAETLSKTSSLDDWRKVIATFAETRLAAQTGQPIIPSSLGSNQLKWIFQDNEREIVLPKPMYEFGIKVAIFKLEATKPDWTCFNVGTYFSVTAIGEPLLNAPIVHGQDSCVNLPSKHADPNVYFPANLFEQINKVMNAFSSEGSGENYVKTHFNKDAAKNLEAVRNIRKSIFEN